MVIFNSYFDITRGYISSIKMVMTGGIVNHMIPDEEVNWGFTKIEDSGPKPSH